MSNPKSSQYLDVVANAFSATQAWRFTSFTLAAVVAVLLYSVIYQSRNTPVVLVPFDLATQGKSMSVSVNGELRGTSAEYMANTALSDLTLILNFTPDNVVTQHKRFLNRVTDELHGQQREAMLAQAEDFKSQAASQSFYPTSTKVNPATNQVEIAGTQIRWVGSRESVRSFVTYVVTYSVFKGYLHVSDLRQKEQNAAK